MSPLVQDAGVAISKRKIKMLKNKNYNVRTKIKTSVSFLAKVNTIKMMYFYIRHVLTITNNSSILRVTTIVSAHSIVGTVKQGGLSTGAVEVVQENCSSSLSIGGTASTTGGCGGNNMRVSF